MTDPMPDDIPQDAKAALDALRGALAEDSASQYANFVRRHYPIIHRSLTANAALTERVRLLEDALNEVRKGVHPQFVLNRLITAALDAGKGA